MGIIQTENLKKYYELNPGVLARIFRGDNLQILKAVDGISFEIEQNEIVGLAGESGCGKTTTGMLLAKLVSPSAGKIYYAGEEVTDLPKMQINRFRKEVQYIFQDPFQSLNPRFTTFDIVAEPLRALKIGSDNTIEESVYETLELVGLKPNEFLNRYPHQMSGGERQRVGIASAMVLKPHFVIADEPVSMLDVSIRSGILDLIKNLSRKLHFACLFISHDLACMSSLCERFIIMYLGKIVESARTKDLIERPLHPYTKALLAATPIPDPRHKKRHPNILGRISQPINLPPGCRFEPRCPEAKDLCSKRAPQLIQFEEDHQVACHFYENAVK